MQQKSENEFTMKYSNVDYIPALLAEHEIVINNEAADLLGREKLVKANKEGLKMRAQHMKNGTMSPKGVQPAKGLGAYKKKPKRDEKEKKGDPDAGMEGMEKYANGVMSSQGVQPIQRLGKAFDQGNNIPGVGTQVPGAVRVGNSYSQATGFVPTDTVRTPTGIYGGRYANGTTKPEGIQPPSLMDMVKGMMNPGEERQVAPRDEGKGVRTVDQARQSMQIKPKVQKFAMGGIVKKPEDEDISTLGTGGNPLSMKLVRAPSNGTPSIVQQGQEATPPQPQQQGSTLTNSSGINTLSGEGYALSSPKLGVSSTPQSLSALDSTIAYNQTPEAKAKFAENAAISAKNYADGRAFDASRQAPTVQQAPGQPDYTPGIEQYLSVLDKSPETMGFGAMIADKKKRENARAGLNALVGLQENAQRTGVDYAQLGNNANQFSQELGFKKDSATSERDLADRKLEADTQAAGYTAQKDAERFGLEQQKFGLEQEKAAKIPNKDALESNLIKLYSAGVPPEKFQHLLDLHQKLYGKSDIFSDLIQQNNSTN
jgi:hypothetical protein